MTRFKSKICMRGSLTLHCFNFCYEDVNELVRARLACACFGFFWLKISSANHVDLFVFDVCDFILEEWKVFLVYRVAVCLTVVVVYREFTVFRAGINVFVFIFRFASEQ